jgi:hypothetical protein
MRRFAPAGRVLTILGIFIGGFSSFAFAVSASNQEDRVMLELAAMGNRGATVLRTREYVLTVLQNRSGCSEWFQEANPEAEEIFRSLRYEIIEHENPNTLHQRDGYGAELWKNPWAAMSFELGGRNSTIRLNANGAFFKGIAPVVDLGMSRWLQPPAGRRALRVASFTGDSAQAQITILLHELAHVIGRIPEDSDSWDGRSGENTNEVLRHCKAEIRTTAKEKEKSRESN